MMGGGQMGTFVEVQRPPAPIILPHCMTINPQLKHQAGGWCFGWGQNNHGGSVVVTPTLKLF